jgi:hypothetical protein
MRDHATAREAKPEKAAMERMRSGWSIMFL